MPFPVDLKYIEAAEKELGVVFPPLFKSKMIEENGGEIPTENELWILFPVFDTSDRKRLSRTCNHIVLENKSAQEWEGYPTGAIAIGHNGSGDFLVLLPKHKGAQELDEVICLWLHETGELIKAAENIMDLCAQDDEML